jgi:hypothetical protein
MAPLIVLVWTVFIESASGEQITSMFPLVVRAFTFCATLRQLTFPLHVIISRGPATSLDVILPLTVVRFRLLLPGMICETAENRASRNGDQGWRSPKMVGKSGFWTHVLDFVADSGMIYLSFQIGLIYY